MLPNEPAPDRPRNDPSSQVDGTLPPPPFDRPAPTPDEDDHVHITRLGLDGTRGYVAAGWQRQRRKVTTDRTQAAIFTRAKARFLIARGRPDPRYKPRIEDA